MLAVLMALIFYTLVMFQITSDKKRTLREIRMKRYKQPHPDLSEREVFDAVLKALDDCYCRSEARITELEKQLDEIIEKENNR